MDQGIFLGGMLEGEASGLSRPSEQPQTYQSGRPLRSVVGHFTCGGVGDYPHHRHLVTKHINSDSVTLGLIEEGPCTVDGVNGHREAGGSHLPTTLFSNHLSVRSEHSQITPHPILDVFLQLRGRGAVGFELRGDAYGVSQVPDPGGSGEGSI